MNDVPCVRRQQEISRVRDQDEGAGFVDGPISDGEIVFVQKHDETAGRSPFRITDGTSRYGDDAAVIGNLTVVRVAADIATGRCASTSYARSVRRRGP